MYTHTNTHTHMYTRHRIIHMYLGAGAGKALRAGEINEVKFTKGLDTCGQVAALDKDREHHVRAR